MKNSSLQTVFFNHFFTGSEYSIFFVCTNGLHIVYKIYLWCMNFVLRMHKIGINYETWTKYFGINLKVYGKFRK